MATQPSTSCKICVSAPGKVILHGEHSVVYGKLALAASLGLRTKLEYIEGGDDRVSIDFPALNLLHFYSIEDIQSLIDNPLPLTKSSSNYNFSHPELLDHVRLLATVEDFIETKSGSHCLSDKQKTALTSALYLLWAFLGTMDIKIEPFMMRLTTDLTVSSGTGSSASFAVVIVAFLLQLVRVKKFKTKSPYRNYKLINTNLEIFDKNELDLISQWAFKSEKIIHGTPSGVDNATCTYGGLVEFRKGSSPKLVETTIKFTLILVNTHVPRDTKSLVQLVVERREKFKSLVDAILDSMEEVSEQALRRIKKINARMGDEFDVLEDYSSLEELVDMNQNLLRCLGVSHQKLDEICFVLAANGLKGKLTGAGGGGYAFCVVPPYVETVVVEKVIQELNSRGFTAVLTDLGGCGVTID